MGPSNNHHPVPLNIRAGRCLNLVRYHRPAQLWHRLLIRVSRSWFSRVRARSYASIGPPLPVANAAGFDRVVQARRDCLEQATASTSDWTRGNFCFLGQGCSLGVPVNWTLAAAPAVDHLWRFHLHYQDYLLDALSNKGPPRRDDAWRLVLDWIDNYPVSAPGALIDGWHPFCISKRLANWIVLYVGAPPRIRADDILGSMVSQASYLSRNLELDLGGNHLLENIRALGLAGAFFAAQEGDRWLTQAERLLRRQLPEQMLTHGEHFERSPMYHAYVLEILLDLRDATRQRAPAISKLCREYADRAAEFLASLLHPDGEIPLFADSVLGAAPASRLLLARANCNTDHAFPGVRADDGYWIFRDEELFVVFDAAPAGPDHLPAHAHADLTTVELSYRGQRFFVDAGVYDYADSEMRRYCRGTAAHNVPQVDMLDQFDLWSRFRVGYRGWPTKLRHAEADGSWWAFTTHNAYRRAKVPVVGRWVACTRDSQWMCVDWAAGEGEHRITNRLHLHPDVKAEICGKKTVRLSRADVALYLHCLGANRVTLATSWYCPRFGERQQAAVIEVDETTSVPAAMGWHLSRRRECPARLSAVDGGWSFSVQANGTIRSWRYDANQGVVRAG